MLWERVQSWWLVGDVPLHINFALSEPPFDAAAGSCACYSVLCLLCRSKITCGMLSALHSSCCICCRAFTGWLMHGRLPLGKSLRQTWSWCGPQLKFHAEIKQTMTSPYFFLLIVFTALHLWRAVLAMSEMYVCRSVCPSSRLSNAWIVKKNKRNVCQNFIPHKRVFYLVFWQEKRLVMGDHFISLWRWTLRTGLILRSNLTPLCDKYWLTTSQTPRGRVHISFLILFSGLVWSSDNTLSAMNDRIWRYIRLTCRFIVCFKFCLLLW